MRKVIALFTALSFLFLPASANAAAPKAGTTCSKANQTQTSNGAKYTCVKSGKKLVWKQVSTPSKPTAKTFDYAAMHSTDDGYYAPFSDPCQMDTNIPSDINEIQNYFYGFNRCAGQLQLGKYSLGQKRPTTAFEPASKFSNVDMCKIVTPKNNRSNLGFTTASPERNEWDKSSKYPAPNTVIQLIPIYSNETAQPVKSPAQDYKVFLDFYRNWIEYSSDFGSNVTIRIPSSYIKMDTPAGGFQLKHTLRWDTPEIVKFNKALVEASDPVIDFSGVNIAIAVPPAGTEAYVFGQAGIGALNTKEGKVSNAMSEYAALANHPLDSPNTNLSHPFWWIHEMMHAGVGLDDHYGDSQNNINGEYGMGNLTLMTPWGGDLTSWEKWKFNFIQDSQIQCKNESSTSLHWIAPSTVQTQQSKVVVIPISTSKAVVIETLRPGGLFYKHPVQSQGALIYEVDAAQDSHGMGMKLSLPIGRKVEGNRIFMASAPLKQGESTISNGYKITVVESGTFGDVIKVEKV